ncbi:hypothetical protein BT96DRAFT_921724, partial [Gymnopus androsaceus JB14]
MVEDLLVVDPVLPVRELPEEELELDEPLLLLLLLLPDLPLLELEPELFAPPPPPPPLRL